MKKITKEFLEKETKEYLSSKINTMARHSLNKNKLIDVVRVGEEIEKLHDNFSIKVETHAPVVNQEKSGRCWLFSGTNILREAVANKYNLESFELSENYISFYDKLEKANWFIEKMTKEMVARDYNDRLLSDLLREPVSDGGYTDYFTNLVEKYGVVPKNVFGETYQSLNTEATNNIINIVLRKMYIELKNNSEKEYNQIKADTLKKVYRILCDIYGVPPVKFDFEYTDKDKKYHIIKDCTPLKFYKESVGINLKEYHAIINMPIKNRPFNKTYSIKNVGNVCEAKPQIYLNVDGNHFKELAIEQLKAGMPVYFESDVCKYINNSDGIMSTKAYDYDALFDMDLSISKGDELITRNTAANHAMCLTGVNLDESGKPNRWRIENSWGEKAGQKGYYVASDDWFEKYAFGLLIHEKFLSYYDKENLTKKPTEVEFWDPIA